MTALYRGRVMERNQMTLCLKTRKAKKKRKETGHGERRSIEVWQFALNGRKGGEDAFPHAAGAITGSGKSLSERWRLKK